MLYIATKFEQILRKSYYCSLITDRVEENTAKYFVKEKLPNVQYINKYMSHKEKRLINETFNINIQDIKIINKHFIADDIILLIIVDELIPEYYIIKPMLYQMLQYFKYTDF